MFTTVRNEWLFASWAMAGVSRDAFVARVGARYDDVLSLAAGGRRYIEKTPNWSVSHSACWGELLPDAHYVLVHRDGRNVVASLEAHRTRRGRAYDFVDECRRWARTMDIFDRVRTSGELRNFRLVRYEDQLADFESVFVDLCRFVAVPEFRPDRVPPNTSFPGATTRVDFAERWGSWPPERKGIFKEHAGAQLTAWGYVEANADW